MSGEATRLAFGGSHSPLTGTVPLVRFMVRRDRIRLPVWILSIVLFTLASVAALPDIYPSEAERQARSALMENPGTRAISGPGYGLDDYTFGAMVSHELLSWIAIFAALMGIFTVVRNTRTEEETGRAELVQSSRVGRHATTTAALVVAVAASALLGALLASGLASLGVEGIGWESSVLFGAAVASIGVVFAAVAAATVQVNEHSRGANGLAGAAFASAYLLRAGGDMTEVGGGIASWLSPIGWAQQTRVYVADRWWPLLLSLALSGILVGVAYSLSTRRDVGAGLFESRPGPAHAPGSLSSALGLAWRLQRIGMLWWGLALSLFAYGYGTLASEVERFVSEMAVIEEAIADIGGTVIDSWLAVVIMVLAVVSAVFATLSALRVRAEESTGRAEPLLATPVSRSAWLGSHLVVALAGSAMLMLGAGLGLGLGAAQALGDWAMLGRILGGALGHLPAIWVVAGAGIALFGMAPRLIPLVWVVVAYAGLVGWLGTLLRFPEWAIDLSPMGHTPLLPAEGMVWTPLAVLVAAATALVLAGMAAFRRRDLQSMA